MRTRKTHYGYTENQLGVCVGCVVTRRPTKHTAVWQHILEETRLPAIPKDVVVLLTGKTHKRFNDLGQTQPSSKQRATGRKFYVIALHDWVEQEFESCYQEFNRYLPALFSKREAANIRRLYLILTYLHELGHAKRWTRGHKSEEYAEEYAWGEMSKLFRPQDVLKVLAFFLLYES